MGQRQEGEQSRAHVLRGGLGLGMTGLLPSPGTLPPGCLWLGHGALGLGFWSVECGRSQQCLPSGCWRLSQGP